MLDTISLSSILPFATLESQLEVAVNSSIRNNFDVSYQCVFGNQKSNATLIGSEFSCNIKKLSSNQIQWNVSIVIVSNYKKNSLLLSKNHVPFYFMSNTFIINVRFPAIAIYYSPHDKIFNLKEFIFQNCAFCSFGTFIKQKCLLQNLF
jgi:hypothetical protein